MSPLEGISRQPNVLVVDDDETHRVMAREALAQAGFSVEVAANGRDGLEAVSRSCPDLLLLDVVMPEMDGFEMCTELRRQRHFVDLPVLMVTSLEDVESIERAFEAGATDFVTKPINWKLLPYHIRYMLRASHTEEALRETTNLLEMARASV